MELCLAISERDEGGRFFRPAACVVIHDLAENS